MNTNDKIKKNNDSDSAIKLSEQGLPFYPFHILREIMVVLIVLIILFLLATILPIGLDRPADSFTTPEKIMPDWYFSPLHQLLEIIPTALRAIVIMFSGLFVFMLLLVPFIDRSKERHPLKRPFFTFLGIIFVVGSLVLIIKTIL